VVVESQLATLAVAASTATPSDESMGNSPVV